MRYVEKKVYVESKDMYIYVYSCFGEWGVVVSNSVPEGAPRNIKSHI